jgi:hypothetical protein
LGSRHRKRVFRVAGLAPAATLSNYNEKEAPGRTLAARSLYFFGVLEICQTIAPRVGDATGAGERLEQKAAKIAKPKNLYSFFASFTFFCSRLSRSPLMAACSVRRVGDRLAV